VARAFAVANQKGGVAKTTTVHALGAAFAEMGRRVLLVDLDPQACLTYSLGLDPEALPLTLHDVLVGRNKASEVAVEVDLAVGSLTCCRFHRPGRFGGPPITRTGREHALAGPSTRSGSTSTSSSSTARRRSDPHINGLTAADAVLIPLQCETLSHRGVGQLLETVADVRQFTQPSHEIQGVIATMFDARTRLGREVLADVSDRYALPVIEPPVPKSVRFAEAPARGRSILEHAPRSPGADAYRAIARTLAASW